MEMLDKNSDLALFKQNWSTYRKIIDEDYMFHREINDGIRSLLSDYFGQKPITVLDLGCGDAGNSTATLKGFNTAYFCGYELSAPALQFAEENVAKIAGTFDLHCQDMLEGVAGKNAQFDLVLSSFSLHHFGRHDKAAFFHSVYRALKDSGLFVLVDTVKGEDESLETYYDHYLAYARQHWTALHPEEMSRVSEHVRSSDYPENAATLEKMANDAGFVRYERVAKYQWHQLSVCYKSAH